MKPSQEWIQAWAKSTVRRARLSGATGFTVADVAIAEMVFSGFSRDTAELAVMSELFA
jgi:hypothetical protein